MKNKIIIGIVAAILFQFIVLAGMVTSSSMPLWTGTQIKVKTVPVDPRSLFRGNYARLGYEFSSLKQDDHNELYDLRVGEIVYLILKKDKNDLYVMDRISLTKPESGIFLRGRIQSRYSSIDIKYGIEAFFAPTKKALELEKRLRNGGIAVLMVSSGGKARLKSIE